MGRPHTERSDDVDGETVLDPRRSDTANALAATRTESKTVAALRSRSGQDQHETGGSSSDPPTRFLRGLDACIDLPPGSVVDDEYEIEGKLGEGAMGIVYRARHVRLGRRVALKAIAPSMGVDPQALGRFAREARALGSLRHPNIVDVYSFGTLPDKRSYYTMEFLDGVTLYDRLQRGRVPIEEALTVLDQMASALKTAHDAGIVHRDLKPENTFLARLADQNTVVKILDWGLARLAVPDGVERTASGAVIGTSLYLSPEQARGPNVDGRTDIYALGVVAYELVLGQHPFPHAQTAVAAIAAHLTEDPPQPSTIWPEIPSELDVLLYAMLSKDPDHRPTLTRVRDVIVSVRSGQSGASSQARAVTAPVARSSRYARAWLGALVALALIAGIMIGARVLGDTSNRDTPRAANATRPIRAGADDTGDTGATPRAHSPAAATSIDVRSDVSDATPTDAAVVDTTSPPRSRTREATRFTATDPASTASDPASTASAIEAGRVSDDVPAPVPSPVVESTAKPPGAPLKPPDAKGPPQRVVPPTPPRPIDRNGTINPFRRGSAAR